MQTRLLMLALLMLLTHQHTAGADQEPKSFFHQAPRSQQQQENLAIGKKLSMLYPLVVSTLMQNKDDLAGKIRHEMKSMMSRARSQRSLSANCAIASASYLGDLLSLLDQPPPYTQELIKFIDAIGKPESGLLQGNFKWLGIRSLCNGIDLPVNDQQANVRLFNTSGRHCIYGVGQSLGSRRSDRGSRVSAPFADAAGPLAEVIGQSLEWGICTPSACNATESEEVTNTILGLVFGLVGPILQNVPGIGGLLEGIENFQLAVTKCPIGYQETVLNTEAYVMLAIGAVIVAIILICTCITALAERQQWDQDKTSLRLSKCFCLYTNLSKVFAPAAPGSFLCLNGIRVLTIFWVVLGHNLLTYLQFSKNPGLLNDDYRKRWQIVIMVNSTMSVEAFFVMSGILVSYLFFKKVGSEWYSAMKQVRNFKFWAIFYFHRYWRLTPPLMFFLFFYSRLVPYYGDSWIYPSDRFKIYDTQQCRENWWPMLAYLQNFILPNEACMSHTWYLAIDMQLFWVSPLMLLLLLYGGFAAGLVTTFAVVAFSMLTAGLLSSGYGFESGSFPSRPGEFDGYFPDVDYYTAVYIKPYCRMSSYTVGLLLGYVMATRKSVQVNRFLALFLWAVAGALGLGLLFVVQQQLAGYGGEITVAEATSYWTFMRPGFGFCVTWVIFACVYGYGGPVNAILSFSLWAPLARISYCVYLVHLVVQYVLVATIDQPLVLSDAILIVLYLGTLLASFLVGLILSLLIESPMLSLERLLLSSRSADPTAAAVGDASESTLSKPQSANGHDRIEMYKAKQQQGV